MLIRLRATRAASVVLVSSNPTNLVLSGAFALSFLSYAAHVVLPFAAAALCVFPLLLTLFRRKEREREREPILIPRRIGIGLTAAEVRATLVDARGAVFGSALLVVTLGVLVGVSTVGVPVWEVTVPPAVVMFGRDVWHDWDAGRARAKAKQSSGPGPGPERDRETEVAGAEGQVYEDGCPGEGESGDAVRRRDGVRSAGDADGDGDVEEEHALHDLSSRTPTLPPSLRATSPSPVPLFTPIICQNVLACFNPPLSRKAVRLAV